MTEKRLGVEEGGGLDGCMDKQQSDGRKARSGRKTYVRRKARSGMKAS